MATTPIPNRLWITGSKDDLTLVTALCPECHKPSLLEVSTEGLNAWLIDGKLIQDALPTLNDTQREQLMTGYCGPCWDEMWAEDDSDETAPDYEGNDKFGGTNDDEENEPDEDPASDGWELHD